MATILDLRTGAPAEEQLKYLKEQLEFVLTNVEDEIGDIDGMDIDTLTEIVQDYLVEHGGELIDFDRLTNLEIEAITQ